MLPGATASQWLDRYQDYPQNIDRRFFRNGQPRTHHVHTVEAGSGELHKHLAFRDALRIRPDWRDQYAA